MVRNDFWRHSQLHASCCDGSLDRTGLAIICRRHVIDYAPVDPHSAGEAGQSTISSVIRTAICHFATLENESKLSHRKLQNQDFRRNSFSPMLNYSRTKPKKKIGIAKNPRVQKNSVKNFGLLTKYNSENISDEVYKNEDIY